MDAEKPVSTDEPVMEISPEADTNPEGEILVTPTIAGLVALNFIVSVDNISSRDFLQFDFNVLLLLCNDYLLDNIFYIVLR